MGLVRWGGYLKSEEMPFASKKRKMSAGHSISSWHLNNSILFLLLMSFLVKHINTYMLAQLLTHWYKLEKQFKSCEDDRITIAYILLISHHLMGKALSRRKRNNN